MTAPAVEVDTSSPVPPYEQVRAQLADAVRAAARRAGPAAPAAPEPAR